MACLSTKVSSNFLLTISTSSRPGGVWETYWRKCCFPIMYYRGGSMILRRSAFPKSYLHSTVLFMNARAGTIFAGRQLIFEWYPGEVSVLIGKEGLPGSMGNCYSFVYDNKKGWFGIKCLLSKHWFIWNHFTPSEVLRVIIVHILFTLLHLLSRFELTLYTWIRFSLKKKTQT